ncbi:MAG: Fic family protein [Sphingomonadaceae bacterium]|nr:Fic family protein [Sphingomonadaceae bacterium]
MVGDPYETHGDPACYPGSDVLRNLPGLRSIEELEAFEVEAVGARSIEAPPAGRFDPKHYRALHRHLFQDVYDWAGEYRTIRTAKGGNWFCYPEHIPAQMETVFARLGNPAFQPGCEVNQFIDAAADFLADLNAIHPFREGNGRAQLYFVRLLGLRAGHPFRLESVERDAFLQAMIDSFNGRLEALIDELERMLA